MPSFSQAGPPLGTKRQPAGMVIMGTTVERILDMTSAGKGMSDREHYFQHVLDSLNIGVAVFRPDRTLAVWNRRYSEMFSFPKQLCCEGSPYSFLLKHQVENGHFTDEDPEDSDAHHRVRQRIARFSNASALEEDYEHVSGRMIAIGHSFLPDGGFMSVCIEGGDDKESEREKDRDIWFEEMNKHDELTGLCNRAHFRAVLEEAVRRALAADNAGVVFVVRLENVHEFSEFIHHGLTNWVLREMADRLNEFAVDSGIVARLSDFEFALVIPKMSDMTDDGVGAFAERVLDCLQGTPVNVGKTIEVDVECGIGSSRFPTDGTDAGQLINYAEIALSHASGNQRNRHVPFRPAMREAVERQDTIKVDLRHATERGELRAFYQPKIDLRSGQTIDMEALVRWQHPERGLVPPGLFIPVAEKTGLIAPISDWMMREAFRQTRAWRDAGIADLHVAVNLSPIQFQRQSVVAAIIAAIDDTGLPPENVEIEITESVLLHDAEVVNETFLWLKSLGIKISIDDFGTGYSSLAYLRRFAIDKIKIDGSFVRELHLNPDDAVIARSIISLAHSLNMKVVGEGIEQPEHVMFLTEEGCDEGQGYFFGRPMPAEAFVKFLLAGPKPIA